MAQASSEDSLVEHYPVPVGIGLGLLALLPHLILPTNAAIAFASVLLGVIAGVYLGFAFMQGRDGHVFVEATAATICAMAGLLGLTVSAWFIPAGYALHGVWDLAHHGRRRGDNWLVKVPVWYPPFCAVVDWIVAAGLILIWVIQGVL